MMSGAKRAVFERKHKTMKTLTYPLIYAVAGLLVASAGKVNAGDSSSCCSASCCNATVAASPKVRAMLDERCKNQCAPVEPAVSASTTTTPHTALAASPKVLQMEKKPSTGVQLASETAAYRPTGADGITTSPKIRAMLDERRQTVEIAPLK